TLNGEADARVWRHPRWESRSAALVCRHKNLDKTVEILNYRNSLPLGSMLLEYRLESVLGSGGFGLTYLGYDTHLETKVAIKEYLPVELAVRAPDGCIVPVSSGTEFNYTWGLDRFLQEARVLAKFTHPNIVSVARYF